MPKFSHHKIFFLVAILTSLICLDQVTTQKTWGHGPRLPYTGPQMAPTFLQTFALYSQFALYSKF